VTDGKTAKGSIIAALQGRQRKPTNKHTKETPTAKGAGDVSDSTDELSFGKRQAFDDGRGEGSSRKRPKFDSDSVAIKRDIAMMGLDHKTSQIVERMVTHVLNKGECVSCMKRLRFSDWDMHSSKGLKLLWNTNSSPP
jgi:hypothetical protein